MPRNTRSNKREKRKDRQYNDTQFNKLQEVREVTNIKIVPKTEAQKKYLNNVIGNDLIFCTGSAGTGKAQPLDENVLTPNGWVKMGSLEIGDYVVSELGEPIKVIETFYTDNLEMYEVLFSDNTTTRCCIDHLWTVQTDKLRCNNKFKVMALRDILPKFNKVSKKKAHYYSIPVNKAVAFKEKPLPIPPYELGYILGNGSSKGYQLIVSIGEEDISVIYNLFDKSLILSTATKADKVGIFALNKATRYAYDSLGLRHVKSIDKYIPEIYKFGSIEQRKLLLAGLLDSDGTCKNNKARFNSSSKQLIEDVLSLIQSLGGTGKISCNDRGRVNLEYALQFRTPFVPFRLERKAKEYIVRPRDNEYAAKKIVSASYIGNMAGKCIAVDSPTQLYITKDYIVTHNTYIATSYACKLLAEKKINQIILTRPAITVGEELGYLKGDLMEKYAPYLEPFLATFYKHFGRSYTEYLFKTEQIVAKPLGFLLGVTFEDAFVIFDEAEDATCEQMKLFLTRIGENCKVVIDGDLEQQSTTHFSGMKDAISLLQHIDNVGFFNFTIDDCIRSKLTKEILIAYSNKHKRGI